MTEEQLQAEIQAEKLRIIACFDFIRIQKPNVDIISQSEYVAALLASHLVRNRAVAQQEAVRLLVEALKALVDWYQQGLTVDDPAVGIYGNTTCCICQPTFLELDRSLDHVEGCPVTIAEAAIAKVTG